MAGNVTVLTDQNFKSTLQEAKIPVLVDFWADWCGPCKMIAPEVQKLADELQGQVLVCKLNVDENRETPNSLGIMSIPTMVIFKEGQEVERTIGYRKKDELKEILQKHL
ncbi:thioredoxin [Desulfotomaculum nigrificans CO-1-SRB]|uniref:Thioredoxin n=1 Tax=Desulfotomaculum nigrificans (strain DSM 14880 / VKM B-2319 / CO-1-SRB) TaxID=868595 RepID=F6B2X0_DESCC|nr:thioredoxin [Desulfotomaculum nigrificans]AEF95078.1 thioredoxin [Desulfotomaculum nigrificans CO-1-SRB]